jgi:hypothetical protein
VRGSQREHEEIRGLQYDRRVCVIKEEKTGKSKPNEKRNG